MLENKQQKTIIGRFFFNLALGKEGENFEFNLNEFIINHENKLNPSDINHVNFHFERIDINDASESLIYEQYLNKFIIAIYGPKEIKQRSKIKNEECSIDVILRFNNDYSKERIKFLQGLLTNYVESLLFTEEYPRCQILLVINLISFSNENELLASLFNGIMFALSTSGIDLKFFGIDFIYQGLSVCLNKDLIISLDANNLKNILYLESTNAYDSATYEQSIDFAEEKISELFKKFKTILIKKLLNNK